MTNPQKVCSTCMALFHTCLTVGPICLGVHLLLLKSSMIIKFFQHYSLPYGYILEYWSDKRPWLWCSWYSSCIRHQRFPVQSQSLSIYLLSTVLPEWPNFLQRPFTNSAARYFCEEKCDTKTFQKSNLVTLTLPNSVFKRFFRILCKGVSTQTWELST